MPPRRFSRHSFTKSFTSEDDLQFLEDREKFLFRELDDNAFHTIKEGDTLQNLAGRFYAPLTGANDISFSPAQLWWILADFQVPPIHDPTILLAPGSTLIIPSLRTVRERVFNAATRETEG